MTTDKIAVFTTVTSEDVALEIAQDLLENYLAACINISRSIRSVYRWKGRIVDDMENLLIIKTRQDKFEEIRDTICRLSGYECPEILAIPIVDGNEAFLGWIDANLNSEDASRPD